jgi:outer membrane protein OmpA-like peptidoglycan-associated protein
MSPGFPRPARRAARGRPPAASRLIRRPLAAAACLLVALGLLGGCSWLLDEVNPARLFRDEPPPPPASTGAGAAAEFPNLASVPDQPRPATTGAYIEGIAEGLKADRENAAYTDEQLRSQGGEEVDFSTASKPPPAEVRRPVSADADVAAEAAAAEAAAARAAALTPPAPAPVDTGEVPPPVSETPAAPPAETATSAVLETPVAPASEPPLAAAEPVPPPEDAYVPPAPSEPAAAPEPAPRRAAQRAAQPAREAAPIRPIESIDDFKTAFNQAFEAERSGVPGEGGPTYVAFQGRATTLDGPARASLSALAAAYARRGAGLVRILTWAGGAGVEAGAELAEQRAIAVAERLQALGVPGDRIAALVMKGPEPGPSPGDPPSGRAAVTIEN